jgi:ABC-2 type transport system permease protein
MNDDGGTRGPQPGLVADTAAPAPRPAPRASWLERYAALFRAAWLVDLQYRAAIVIWLLLGVTQPLVMLTIWWSVAGGGAVGGYGRPEFARYFFAVMLVDQLTLAWDIWYIDRWVREGELNFRLVRPFNPIHEAIADNLAYKTRSASLVVVVWVVVAAVWPAVRLPLEPVRWAAAAMAIMLAAALRFLVSFSHGLFAFWTTRATGVFQLHQGVSMFLAGRIAPLALLPPAVATVAGVLWFRSSLAFPVEVLTGTVPLGMPYVRGIAVQLIWTLVWLAAYRALWLRGVRRYEAVGG